MVIMSGGPGVLVRAKLVISVDSQVYKHSSAANTNS